MMNLSHWNRVSSRLTPCVKVLAMIEVNAVEAVSDFGLVLTFNNGEQRRFDLRPSPFKVAT